MSELRISRTFDAPVDRVWAAFTGADALAAWFWPERLGPTVTVDVRVGGQFRIAATAAGFAVSGTYREVMPPTRLVMTWRWDGEDSDSLVTIDLTAHGQTTDLELRHEQLPSDESRDQHAHGWHDCLDRLPDWLSAPVQS